MTLAWTLIGRTPLAAAFAALAVVLAVTGAPAVDAAPQPVGPFTNLDGWWAGGGRLRFKDGKQEDVKCRATYFVAKEGNELKQTIRCASGGAKIEVLSTVEHGDGKLSGEWKESTYNVTGVLEGEVTPRGFRVSVKGTGGTELSANMDIIVKDERQIVEIQFFSDTLVGLTLLLNKG
jgi:hypothetical protein